MFGKIFKKYLNKPPSSTSPSVNLVVERFLQLFHDHGLVDSQIPQLLPEVKLSDLKSPDALLNILDHALLTKVANLFGVRVEWLTGVDNSVYEDKCNFYKHPEEFFKYIAKFPKPKNLSPIKVLTDNKNLDYKSPYNSTIALIYVEEIARLGDQIVNRYHVLDSAWNWHHPPCRIQLKAIARLLWKEYGYVISIYETNERNLEEVCERRAIPAPFMDVLIPTEPSLEDYGIGANEFGVSKESEEFEQVLQYIEERKLGTLVEQLKPKKSEADESPTPSSKLTPTEKASIAAKERNKKLNELKNAFFEKYADAVRTKSIKATQAAREFYFHLNEEQEKLLCRSKKDFESSNAEELRMRAERTLTSALRDHLKNTD